MLPKRTFSDKGTKRKYHIEMTSLSLFFWAFGLCFLLAWIFVLGVLVGRGFLPSAVSTISDLKTQIVKLQGLVTHGKTSSAGTQKAEDIDPQLDFYKKLSSKKEEVRKKEPSDEKAGQAKGSVPKAKPESPPGVASVDRRVEPPLPSQPPAVGSGAPNGLQFTVQLAALEDKGKAESMVKALREKGLDGYFYEVKIKGKTRYRVRSGKFMNREEASEYARKLADQAGMNGFVTRID